MPGYSCPGLVAGGLLAVAIGVVPAVSRNHSAAVLASIATTTGQ